MSKRLGRGLDALIPALDVNDEDHIIEVELTELRPNPYQPRKSFNEDSINELAKSIQEHGVIQPIIVRKVIKGYEIIAGERRFRAAAVCGLSKIPAVLRKFSDQQVMEIALIENLQREDLNAIEIALAYQGLVDTFSLTQEELSTKVGKSRSHIANFLRLLQLPEDIKQYVSRGTLSMGHARCIVGIKSDKIKKEMAEKAIQEQWSVRELEEAIKQLEEIKEKPKQTNKKVKKNPFFVQIEENLREHYQTDVKIHKEKNKGKIELLFYSDDDLQRILDLLSASE